MQLIRPCEKNRSAVFFGHCSSNKPLSKRRGQKSNRDSLCHKPVAKSFRILSNCIRRQVDTRAGHQVRPQLPHGRVKSKRCQMARAIRMPSLQMPADATKPDSKDRDAKSPHPSAGPLNRRCRSHTRDFFRDSRQPGDPNPAARSPLNPCRLPRPGSGSVAECPASSDRVNTAATPASRSMNSKTLPRRIRRKRQIRCPSLQHRKGGDHHRGRAIQI